MIISDLDKNIAEREYLIKELIKYLNNYSIPLESRYRIYEKYKKEFLPLSIINILDFYFKK